MQSANLIVDFLWKIQMENTYTFLDISVGKKKKKKEMIVVDVTARMRAMVAGFSSTSSHVKRELVITNSITSPLFFL